MDEFYDTIAGIASRQIEHLYHADHIKTDPQSVVFVYLSVFKYPVGDNNTAAIDAIEFGFTEQPNKSYGPGTLAIGGPHTQFTMTDFDKFVQAGDEIRVFMLKELADIITRIPAAALDALTVYRDRLCLKIALNKKAHEAKIVRDCYPTDAKSMIGVAYGESVVDKKLLYRSVEPLVLTRQD